MVNGILSLHQRYIYRGYSQIASYDLIRSNHPALWFIIWDPTSSRLTQPLAIQKEGTWFSYGWDFMKNVSEIFNTNGYIQNAYTYSPYGKVEASGNFSNPIQWSSEVYDSELSVVYYNYRSYNPIDGRWLSADPIGIKGGLNTYIFVGNAPILGRDALGLATQDNVAVCKKIDTDKFKYSSPEARIGPFILDFDTKLQMQVCFDRTGKVYGNASLQGSLNLTLGIKKKDSFLSADGDPVKYNIFAGLQGSAILSTSGSFQGSYDSRNCKINFDFKRNIGLTLKLKGGLDFSIKTEKKKISFSAFAEASYFAEVGLQIKCKNSNCQAYLFAFLDNKIKPKVTVDMMWMKYTRDFSPIILFDEELTGKTKPRTFNL